MIYHSTRSIYVRFWEIQLDQDFFFYHLHKECFLYFTFWHLSQLKIYIIKMKFLVKTSYSSENIQKGYKHRTAQNPTHRYWPATEQVRVTHIHHTK